MNPWSPYRSLQAATASALLALSASAAEPAGAPDAAPDVRLEPLVDERQAPEGTDEKAEAEAEDREFVLPLASGGTGASALFDEADLRSYFLEPRLAEAKAAFDRHRPLRAREILESAADVAGLRYLSALAAMRAGQYLEAAQKLDALCGGYESLADECLFHAAQAHERLRHLSPAIERYGRISPSSRRWVEARFSMARLLQKKRDLRAAMEALSPLAFDPPAPVRPKVRAAALIDYADLARKAGGYNPEHRALLTVWSSFPESPEAARAEKRLAHLPIPGKARVARAEAFLALHLNDDAIEAARRVLKNNPLPSSLACRAQFAVGKALRKERRHAGAIATLLPVVERCEDPDLRARALFVLGYSQSVLAPPAALLTYDALVREYPMDALAPQSLFYAAEMAARTGALADAAVRLDRLVRTYPRSPFSAEALFKRAWIQRKQGNPRDALAALDATWALPPGAASLEQRARAQYWKARWLEASGDDPVPLVAYEAVVHEAPMSYYALLARARLESRDAERAARVLDSFRREHTGRWPLDAGPLLSSPRFLAGVELIRLGLPHAEKELASIDVASLPGDSARLLFQVLKEGGFERQARIVIARLLRASGGGLSHLSEGGAWSLAYPPLLQDVIEPSAEQARVDPDLLRALIREESAFNPRARSSTGALGLTQLMPRTAGEVARDLKWRRPGHAALVDPRKNARLGAEYLAKMLRQFDQQHVFAVAAYNAGPDAVERWRRDRPPLELDAWVEEIPFEETRGYVKRVLGSYGAYRLLRAAEPPARQAEVMIPARTLR